MADLWTAFKGKDLGSFYDIDQLAMFPDYRVPQVLLHFGVLKYTDYLKELLESGKPYFHEHILSRYLIL